MKEITKDAINSTNSNERFSSSPLAELNTQKSNLEKQLCILQNKLDDQTINNSKLILLNSDISHQLMLKEKEIEILKQEKSNITSENYDIKKRIELLLRENTVIREKQVQSKKRYSQINLTLNEILKQQNDEIDTLMAGLQVAQQRFTEKMTSMNSPIKTPTSNSSKITNLSNISTLTNNSPNAINQMNLIWGTLMEEIVKIKHRNYLIINQFMDVTKNNEVKETKSVTLNPFNQNEQYSPQNPRTPTKSSKNNDGFHVSTSL